MRTGLLPIDTVISDYLDFSAYEGTVNKRRIKKYASDCVNRFATNEQLIERVVLMKVKYYEAVPPKGFHSVIQAGYRASPAKPCRREEIVEFMQRNASAEGCNLTVSIDCPTCHQSPCGCKEPEIVVEVDRIWESLRPEWYYKHMKHYYSSGGLDRNTCGYHPEFKLMRPAQNNFFGTSYHIPGCINLGKFDSDVEYRYDGEKFIVTFEEGEILLAGLFKPVDEDGYRYVPNIPEAFEAINWWIEERLLYQELRSDPSKERLYRIAVETKNAKLELAKERLATPAFADWWGFLQNHWMKVRPYTDFEENLGRAKPDDFDTYYPEY
jgi:hypothetical protein